MAGYKDDRLAMKIANFDERLNQEDDVVGTDENTPEDMFFALGEEHAGEDSVEVATYDPSTFAWAGEKTLLSPTFARSSVANSPETGGSVKANEPRYVSGKFDMGVVVEEGTTNLLTANQSSVETNTTGFYVNGAGVTITRDTTHSLQGSASLRVVTPGAGSAEGSGTLSTNVTASQTYTASVCVRGVGTVVVTLHERDTSDAFLSQTTSSVVTLTSEWQRISVTRTFGATGAKARILVVTTSTQATTFYVDALQLEAKSYATSWVLGGTTRASETLTLPTTGLTPTQGTIAAWVYVNSVARRQVSGQFPTIFHVINPSNTVTSLGVWFYHEPASATWRLQTRSGTNTSAVSSTISDSLTPDGWHRFAVTWSGDIFNVYLDGVQRSTMTTTNHPSSFGALALGWRGSSSTDWLNTYFDNVVVDTIAWSDADVAADYASGVPYAPTTTTTAVVNFDGSLTGENYEYTDAGFDWNYGGRWSDE